MTLPIVSTVAPFGDNFLGTMGIVYSPISGLAASICGCSTRAGEEIRTYSINTETGVVTPSAVISNGSSFVCYTACCSYDSAEDKFVFFYNENTGAAFRCVVGSSSGSMGSPVTVRSASDYFGDRWSSAAYSVADAKHVVFFNVSGVLYYSVGSVSGSSSSWGTATSLSLTCNQFDAVYNEYTGKIMLAYGVGSNLYVAEVTISGSTITLDSHLIYSSWADTAALGVDPVTGYGMVVSRNTGASSYFSMVDQTGVLVETQNYGTTGFVLSTRMCVSVAYDGFCKKLMIVLNNAPESWGTSVTWGDGTFSLKTPALLRASGVEHGQPPALVYASEVEKFVILEGNRTKNIYTAQIDEEAPKPFWTNFHGQTETVV